MTVSRSRAPLSIQPFLDILSRFRINLFVETPQAFFANDEPGSVSERFRP